MKYLMFFLLLIISSYSKLYGQKYDFYGLSLRSVYLPMGLVKGEAYFNKNNEEKHIEFFNKFTHDSLTRIEIEPNYSTIKNIEKIDSLIDQNDFEIAINSNYKDSIFLKIIQANIPNFNRSNYESYFKNDTCIVLSINKFKKDSTMENITTPDEPWYTLNIIYSQVNSTDTVNKDLNFVGSDYIKTSNIKNWIIGFIVLNRMHLFNDLPHIRENVSEKNLVEVITRYIISQGEACN